MHPDLETAVIAFARRAHHGAQIAFAASHWMAGLWRLSVVRKDEDGHYPLSDEWTFGTFDQMSSLAAKLNDQLGLTKTQAAAYVASSMEGSRK